MALQFEGGLKIEDIYIKNARACHLWPVLK